MPCPICNHTVQSLSGNLGLFWCPRCGTLLKVAGDFQEHEAPRWTKLISEARHGISFNEYQSAQVTILKEKNHVQPPN